MKKNMETFREKINELEKQSSLYKKARSAAFIALVISLFALLIAFTSCGPSLNELAKKNNWSQSEINRIEDGRITTGFTKPQVKAAWGNPVDINYTTLPNKVKEQWVYGKGYNRRYVYFVNGKVTAIQH